MQIVHLSAECYPVAKVGGLADVVGALPKYLNNLDGVQSMVVMPFVENEFTKTRKLVLDYETTFPFGNRQLFVKILKNDDLGFPVFLVQIEGFAHREEVYGYRNDSYFFTAFQIAALNWIHQWSFLPDVIHCHDYHTGFVPFFMKHAHQYPRFRDIPSVFTIHNGEYQGQMPWEVVDYFPWFNTWDLPVLEFDNTLHAMATAIKTAWRVTTVSPQYMKELMDGESTLSSLLRHERKKCVGILNGIDIEEWNPETDNKLDHQYSRKTVEEGKNRNKQQLCDHFSFNPEYPIISFIGRFVDQKGADVLSDAIWKALTNYDSKINFLILGSGDNQLANGLEQMKIFTDGRFNCFIGYNEALAHKVYAGSDFLIMPSRFEPCGLNQFYALRYGTVPIVRTVGGLLDSVKDINDEGGNGIRFINLNTDDLLHSFYRATELYQDKERFQKIRKFIMKQDFSWEASAKKYMKLYEEFR